ncbi:MAG TPA: sorbosone dehydrogenase, partial [Methylophaga sp.]|nr:sorbosone dehydrogenase [Methylophaga sp.]
MQHPSIVGAFIGVLAVSLTGCGDRAKIPPQADYGPEPTLVAPKQALIPTVKIAPAKGWPIDGEPIAAEGLQVNRFAMDLDHPRWLYVLPNGDVLVAESNAPESEKPNAGIKDWIKG